MIYLNHLQGVTEPQKSQYKNKDGLLNTLKFVSKMFADIIKFICSIAELDHKMRRFIFTGFYSGSGINRFLQLFWN